ncbi:hypothetical protein [Streptomyces sp. NPDC056491]|uniref:hypothetical protein n=1 Tax=Streptomyces sp. NPDC056491 TaxID=3345837 RepID=UPI00368DC82C
MIRTPSANDFADWSEEEALILWANLGYGDRQNFPGVRLAALFMLHGVDAGGRRMLGRLFASLAPHPALRLLLVLLLALTNRPARIASPAPAPLALTSQRRSLRITPSRAP